MTVVTRRGAQWRRLSAAVTCMTMVPLLMVLDDAPARAATGNAQATVAVQLSAAPVTAGDPLTAAVAVTAADPVSGMPTGTVQFTVDGAPLGGPVTLVGGQAATPATGLTVGRHQIGARYSGDAAFAAADAGPGATEVVVPRDTAAFVPVQPARILDTRSGPRPAADSTLTLTVAGHGGVPATGATAVALNVTATGAQARGFVTVWPADQSRPLASNLNLEFAGQSVPNLVVVPLSAAGAVNLYAQPSTHLIADVAGYFTAARSATAGRLVPLTPARLLDTRTGPRPGAGATVTLTAAGHGGVPADGARGVVLNVTATNTTAPTGYVTVWPADQPRPLASNLNTTHVGETIPNAVWVPLSTTGAVSLYVSTGADLVVDVAGWFTGAAAQDSTAGLFVPTKPTRLLDTRAGTGYSGAKPGADSTVALKVAGVDPVPATGAAAVVMNVTATASDARGFVTAYPAGPSRPLASNLNLEVPGQTRPNLVTTPLGGTSVNLYTSGGTHLVADVAGYFTPDLNPAPPVSQHETYQPAPSTAVLDAASVSVVSGGPTSGYTVTLIAGVAAPAAGAGIVVKGGGSAYPDGLAGTVSTVTAGPGGTTTLQVAPAPVDQLLNNLDIGFDGPADLVAQPAGGAAPNRVHATDVVGGSTSIDHSLIDFGAGAFECDTATGVTVSASVVRFENTRVHFEKRFGLLTAPFVQFYVITEPVVQFSGDVHGKVSCHLSNVFRRTHRLVWVLPTEVPVTVDLAPALQFEATVAGKVTFTEHFYRMVGLTTNPDLSVHVYNAASQTTESVDVTAELSASLLLGADVSVKVLDVAGIGVTLGPQFVASVDTHTCVRLTVSVHADFDVRLDQWIKQFKHTFLGFDLGPWTVYYHCLNGGPGGGAGSPLAVSTGYLPVGSVGQPYSATLLADGGSPPYSWNVTGLPPWMRSDSAGHLGGTPPGPSSEPLTVTVSDSRGQQATGYIDFTVGSPAAGADLISATPGGQPGNGPSLNAMTSTDGRYVYFDSSATNLTTDHLSKQPSVYLRDRTAATTQRIDLPGDAGALNKLRAVSSNGRFAIILSSGADHLWRYDRQTGTAAALPLGLTGSQSYSISDDGDLVDAGGGAIFRISDGSFTALTCPTGSMMYPPGWVRFASDGSVVYFVTDQCGQYWESAFRFDLATKTSTVVLPGKCFWNGGNACVDMIVPTGSGAHQAITRLIPDDPNGNFNLLVDNKLVTSVPSIEWICGISEDGNRVAFVGRSDLIPGGTPDGGNVFTVDVGTGNLTRVSPVGPSSTCTDRGLTGTADQLVYEYSQQIYGQSIP